MKDHVPDLERCKQLEEKGFPGDNSLLVYALTEIRSEDPKHRHNEWILMSRDRAVRQAIEGDPYYRLIAAPIVTELLGEIRKLKEGRYMRVFIGMGAYDGVNALWQGIGEYAESFADTLPNALADLWMWLRERGE